VSAATVPAIAMRGAAMRYGARTLWEGLDLDIEPGEFVAVLGPNGAGKTTLIRILLGLTAVTSGTVSVAGRAPSRGDERVGYVPQQRALDRDLPVRGRDLVRLGLDGHRRGLPLMRGDIAQRVDEAIAAVGARAYADAPVGQLSGGEQQRLRIAQAIAGHPLLLLCDEPLLSLDPGHQQGVTELLDRQRRERGTTVLFVTHEINPVLPYVDRVLYLAEGRWAAGAPDDVFTGERLSELYGTPIDVLRVRDRIVVVGVDEESHHHEH
jgi:zinc/manganese transport system ATP-binding protein